MLGGGVPVGEVTEFCGVPGVGKTQMGMQLAVDVQIPKAFGGQEGEAIYIDTEGSFVVERVAHMAQVVSTHIQLLQKQKKQTKEIADKAAAFTQKNILENIYCYRACDFDEQQAILAKLPSFLEAHPKVKLVVIDSVAFHFRQYFSDMSARARILTTTAQKLNKLATDYNLAVVIVNQVTTKPMGKNQSSGVSDSVLVPALGESWSHAATNRVVLFWQDGVRYAHLLKSPSRMNGTVKYMVDERGIRDLPLPAAGHKRPFP
jgi:RAD51-like protein 2